MALGSDAVVRLADIAVCGYGFGQMPVDFNKAKRICDVLSMRYPAEMSTNVKIEVDARTADVLQARAAELGVTVSELIAELAALDSDPVVAESDDIAELDRRWDNVQAGQSTVPHQHVVRWLRTWGTPRFRPWRDQ